MSTKHTVANLLDSSNPDVVVGIETWLSNNMKSSEFFNPEQYEVCRNDRQSGHGGVLIAVKKELDSQKISIKTTGEDVGVKVTHRKKKPVLIGSWYRPPKADLSCMQGLCQSVGSMIKKNNNTIIMIGGDPNLPDIDWNINTTVGNQYPKAIGEEFIELFQDHSLQQMVLEATRFNNTFDVFITNRPTLLKRLEIIPGVSDDDIVFINTYLEVQRRKPVKRKLYLWKKANIEKIRETLEIGRDHFMADFEHSSSVEVMWQPFKNLCQQTIKDFVPTKFTPSRFNPPRVNRKVMSIEKEKETTEEGKEVG